MSKRKCYELLSAAALIVVCCGGKVYGIMPFGTPMFCALGNVFFVGYIAPIYLGCAFLFTFELYRLYTAGAVIFLCSLRWFLGLKFTRMSRYAAKTVCSFVTIAAEAALLTLFVPVADALISGFVSLVFYYFADVAARAAANGFSRKGDVAEGAALFVISLAAGLSFVRAKVDGLPVGLAPAYFYLLALSLVGRGAGLVAGAGLSVGCGLAGGAGEVGAIVACASAVAAFSRLPRVVFAAAGIAMYAAFSVLFGASAASVGYGAAMMAAGAALFCLIPPRAVRALRQYFDFDGCARLAVRHYINRAKTEAGNRMIAVATVFDETARLMNTIGENAPDYAALANAMCDSVCPYCVKQRSCDRAAALEAYTRVAESAYAGKAIIAELPEFFSSSCPRTVDIVASATRITEKAKAQAAERECVDKAKTIVTERLTAVRDVLEALGVAEGQPVGFDGEAEEKIAAELNSRGVECGDVFCSKDGVVAVVRSRSAERGVIEKAVKACLKREFEANIEKTQASGWSVAALKPRPRFEAVYARAGLAKNGISGDSYTFRRIGDKFLVALLDGMGSGTRAGESSGAAAELIECFYRAGFDSNSVMTGVNRFLKLPADESYSAVDVAALDLDSGAVDIVKLGSPPCYIKTADTVLRFEGSSLPIGAIDEVRPFIAKKIMYPGQMLVLVTDGVADCFHGDELPSFLNCLPALNPEKTAKAILDRALALSGGTPNDDMTAVAVRMYGRRQSA